MTLFPEVQKRAQQELDTVIGTDRLPTMADKENLPYICALASEVFRWHPIAPLGVPHVSTEADVYGKFAFSKGTVFIPNIMCVEPMVPSSAYSCHFQQIPPRSRGLSGPMGVQTRAFPIGGRARTGA